MKSLVSGLAAVHPQSSSTAHLQIACRRGGTRREVVGHREYLVQGVVCRRRVAARGNKVVLLVARGWVGLGVVLEFDLDG